MEKAMEILKNRTLEELVSDFEATTDNNDANIPMVRGWLMDAIEEKNPVGYDKWLENEECEDSDLRKYVL